MIRRLAELAIQALDRADARIPPGSVQVATLFVGVVAYAFGGLTTHEITAIGNAAWGALGGMGAAVAHGLVRENAHRLRNGELPMHTTALEVAYGLRLSGLCLLAHRGWWNLGIFFREETGAYWPLVVDNRWFAVLMIAGIIRGFHRAAAPFLRRLGGHKRLGAECGISALSVITQWPA